MEVSISSLTHDNTLLYYICHKYNQFKSERHKLLSIRDKHIEKDYINYIKILLKNGAIIHINDIVCQRKLNDLNLRIAIDEDNNTILLDAILSYNDELLKLLLDYNIDLSKLPDDILFRIIDKKKVRIIKLLLSNGVKINNEKPYGSSLLKEYVMQINYIEDLEGLYLLLSYGATDNNIYIMDRGISLFIQIYDLLIKYDIITIEQILNLDNDDMDHYYRNWKKDILLLYIFYNYDNESQINSLIKKLPYYREIDPEIVRILFSIKSIESNHKIERIEPIKYIATASKENNKTVIQKFLNASKGPRKDWMMSISSFLGKKKYDLKFPFFILHHFNSSNFLKYSF